jgi:hypothetical protein
VDFLCESSRQRAESAASNYHKELGRRSLERGLLGGVVGAALLGGAYQIPHGFVIGPLFGASVGLYTAWESLHREKTGTVTVRLDDKTYEKPFYSHPNRVALTEEEARFQVLAEGGGGASQVRAYHGNVDEPTAGGMESWKSQASTLRGLAEQRRLVASLGQTTEDGQAVVHLVDGLAAARLAAQGGKVYVVCAEPPQDREHSMTMMGFNVARSVSNAEEYRYLERGVDYQLLPLRTPADLVGVAEAQGVPEGMFGLLENAQHYAEVVNCGNQIAMGETDSPEFGNRPARHSERVSHSVQERLKDRGLKFEAGVITRHYANLPALLGLAGTTAGLMTALALTGPGAPGPALMAATVGFLGGRALGRVLIR